MKLSYLDLMTTDPSYNLAMEQYVFDCLPRDRMYFMLWQNDNAIIVGKYQNTISEINEEAVRERGIRVVRRLSGGGAVYHDMGNLNFTFITDAGGSGTLDMKLFCEPVVRTLAALGVRAEVNPLGAQPCDECRRASARAGHAAGVPPYPAGKHSAREPGRGIPADARRPCGGGEAAHGALCHLGVELWEIPCLHDAAPPPHGRLRADRGVHHGRARPRLGGHL